MWKRLPIVLGLWSKLDRQVVALVSRVLCVVSWSFAAGLNDVYLPSFPWTRHGNPSVSERLGGWVVECAIVGPWVFLLEIAHSEAASICIPWERCVDRRPSSEASSWYEQPILLLHSIEGIAGNSSHAQTHGSLHTGEMSLNLWTIVRDAIG